MAKKYESRMNHIDVTLESSDDDEENDYEDLRAGGEIHYEMFGRVLAKKPKANAGYADVEGIGGEKKKPKAYAGYAEVEGIGGEEHFEMYSRRARSDSVESAHDDRAKLLGSQELAGNFDFLVPSEIQFGQPCPIIVSYPNNNVNQQHTGSDIDLSVTVNGLPVPVTVKSDRLPLSCEFRPQSADDHMVSVKFKGYHIQGSPATCKVDSSNMEGGANNLVLSFPPTPGENVEFVVDAKQGREKKDDSWNVTVESTSGENIVVEMKDYCDVMGNQLTPVKYTFTPTSSDAYTVSVKIGDCHIKGSPANYENGMISISEKIEGRSELCERDGAAPFLGPMPELDGAAPVFDSITDVEEERSQPERVRDQRIPSGSYRLNETTNISRPRRPSSGDYEALGRGSSAYTYPYFTTTRTSNVTLMPKQVLEDIALYRTNRPLKHVDPVEHSSVQVTISRFDPNTTTHVKITREAFKIGIERQDVELLDVVIPFWKNLKEDGSWHPMIQIAKENNAALFSRLALKHAMCIPEPHNYFCSKENCPVKDSLKHSLLRINTYKALAQPAHLLAKEDPIREAFQLRRQILDMSNLDKEFKTEYLLLSDNVEQFCCDMAKLCGRKKELDIFLDRSHIDVDKEKSKLGTVEMGYKDEAKQFVAHEFVQRHLHEEFYGESPQQQKFFLKHNNFTKLFMSILLSPVVLVMILGYILFGGIKTLKEKYPTPFYYINALKDPIIRFYIHTMSYIVFLILLLVYTLLPVPNEQPHRNTGFSWLLWCIAFYILGYAWAEMKQLYTRTYRTYFQSVYNWLDSLMIIIYCASYACRVVALFKTNHTLKFKATNPVGPYPEEIQYYLETDRSKWSPFDPEIMADSLFAVANLLSFARLSYILPAFERLGPLLVILGKVLYDTIQFMALFVIVFFAFLVGIHNLYKFYPDATFSTFWGSFGNLFWGVFAMTDRDSTNFHSEQAVVQAVGFLMFGTFHVLIVVMLLNMLIAMLSASYETTDERKDVEWKFSRAGLWMDYILKGETLPVPFNIIPTMKSVIGVCMRLKALCSSKAKLARQRKSQKSSDKHTTFREQYLRLMRKLKLKYAKSILDGQDIVVSINQVNHEVIGAPIQEPSTSQPATDAVGGDGDIIRKTTSQPVSSSPRDLTDGRVAKPTQSDPFREVLLKYFMKRIFSESYTSKVIDELQKYRQNIDEETDTIQPTSL